MKSYRNETYLDQTKNENTCKNSGWGGKQLKQHLEDLQPCMR